jgi:hypothetical protein
MKALLLTVIYLFFSLEIFPQQFVKITEGPHVNDGGDSRSVNWIDYDGDGWLDLFVSNGPNGGQNNFLYKNNGDNTFTKITGIAITSDNRSSDGSTWGDFDNDGNPDLFVANWYNQNNLLYKNNGDGTFELLSSSIVASDGGYSEAGSWGDYNNDGFIDLYVCNSEGNRRNFLYKNNGDGTFTKITTGSQSTDAFYSRNADWIDIDNDGYVDLFVANETNQNENLYKNNGDETFTSLQITNLLTSNGNSTSSSWEDIDNDGDLDVFIANYGGQENFLFTNNGDGTFTKILSDPVANEIGSSFGSVFGDVDNDGDLDLFVTNAFTTGRTKNFFYLNNGNGTFTKDTTFDADLGWSYGCAFGDYNKDGYLDLFIAKCFGATENNTMYKNTGGNNNWLGLDLEGVVSNKSAIGAIVKVKANVFGNSTWQMRRVAGQTGYCGQTLQLHFGLGDASIIDSMIIEWPSGGKKMLTQINVNEFLNISEDTTATSVKSEEVLPNEFMLFQNYPNPFNPSTKISWQSNVSGWQTIKLFDPLGREVDIIINEYKEAGYHSVSYSVNSELPSGIYYYQLRTQTHSETKKMVVLK